MFECLHFTEWTYMCCCLLIEGLVMLYDDSNSVHRSPEEILTLVQYIKCYELPTTFHHASQDRLCIIHIVHTEKKRHINHNSMWISSGIIKACAEVLQCTLTMIRGVGTFKHLKEMISCVRQILFVVTSVTKRKSEPQKKMPTINDCSH